MALSIQLVPLLRDNYAYLLRDDASGKTAVVDPSEHQPVLQLLQRLGWRLDYVMNTHHHHDHSGGNLGLKAATGCVIVGPKADEARIPGIDIALADGENFDLGAARATVIDIPGHTKGHIAFWFAAEAAVFCGDTLFALGCGRMFEGTPPQMWHSLTRLRDLPPETRVYCGHEYTQANARFALTLDGANPALVARAAEIDQRRARGEPTIPSTIGEERRTNPFLRGDDAGFAAALGLGSAKPDQVFAEIRRRKDAF